LRLFAGALSICIRGHNEGVAHCGVRNRFEGIAEVGIFDDPVGIPRGIIRRRSFWILVVLIRHFDVPSSGCRASDQG
jgi:hypothetical protein